MNTMCTDLSKSTADPCIYNYIYLSLSFCLSLSPSLSLDSIYLSPQSNTLQWQAWLHILAGTKQAREGHTIYFRSLQCRPAAIEAK